MFSLFNRKKNNHMVDKVPEWAHFFNLKELNSFLEMVKANFPEEEVIMNVEEASMKLPESFGDDHFGLLNLAITCHKNKQEEWKKIIHGHFDSFVQQKLFMDEFAKIIGDFSKVSQYLAVRLWPDSYAENFGQNDIVIKKELDGILAGLVYDLPTTVRNASLNEIEPWNKNVDELFEIGLNNVRENYDFEAIKVNLNENECYILNGNHFFLSTFALLLNEYSEYLGEHGAIVGIPDRHKIIVYPVNGIDALSSLMTLIGVVSSMNKEEDGPISPNLYWYKDSRYVKIPYGLEDENKIGIHPPDELVSLLS